MGSVGLINNSRSGGPAVQCLCCPQSCGWLVASLEVRVVVMVVVIVVVTSMPLVIPYLSRVPASFYFQPSFSALKHRSPMRFVIIINVSNTSNSTYLAKPASKSPLLITNLKGPNSTPYQNPYQTLGLQGVTCRDVLPHSVIAEGMAMVPIVLLFPSIPFLHRAKLHKPLS